MSEAKDDIAVMFPGREVTCKGEAVAVGPIYFGLWPQAGRLAKPLVTAMREANLFSFQSAPNAAGESEMTFALSPGWMAELPMLLDDGGEAIMAFIAFAVGKPREWLNTLPSEQGLDLTVAIFEENRDFFGRKVLPMLQAAGIFKANPKDGSASPTASSDSATAGMPSSA